MAATSDSPMLSHAPILMPYRNERMEPRVRSGYKVYDSDTHIEPSAAKRWQLQPEDIAQVVINLLNYPQRALPSRIEIRPSQPPKR